MRAPHVPELLRYATSFKLTADREVFVSDLAQCGEVIPCHAEELRCTVAKFRE
jgi:hypothetical protein